MNDTGNIMDERYNSVPNELALDSIAVRVGSMRTQEQEHSEALFPTSSYVFSSAEEAAAVFSGEQEGNVYSRYTNPTVAMFERRIAALEGAESAVASASGMSAIFSVCMAFLRSGDEILCSRNVFGTTVSLLSNYMAAFGVTTKYVDLTDLPQWESAINERTRLLFLESPSNPLSQIADIPALANLAHQNNALLVVDNCFCTPVLQNPLLLGADIVVHSATKYLDGQGRCMGGVVCGSQEKMEPVSLFLRAAGPCMSPFNAWVLLKSLETLPLRVRAHCRNTEQLAYWLTTHPAVSQVFYAGLPEHPQHELAKQQQNGLFGGVLAFRVRGSQQQAWQVINATQMISITANLGDTRTTVTHPASTTHVRLSDADKQASGITDDMLRVAVGLEDVEDIIADLKRGLDTLL